MPIIRDIAERTVEAYERFLWSDSTVYTKSCTSAHDCGTQKLSQTHRRLFSHLKDTLRLLGLDPQMDVKSVFEVGCSMGFLLRFMETDMFPSATELEGVDSDDHAVRSGKAYLRNQQSKCRLFCADTPELDRVMGEKQYDVILCAGGLAYLNEEAAAKVVMAMIRHAKGIVAISGRAHPEVDNAELSRSESRSGGVLMHNIDAMIQEAGARILFRTCEDARAVDGYTVICSRRAPRATQGAQMVEFPAPMSDLSCARIDERPLKGRI